MSFRSAKSMFGLELFDMRILTMLYGEIFFSVEVDCVFRIEKQEKYSNGIALTSWNSRRIRPVFEKRSHVTQ